MDTEYDRVRMVRDSRYRYLYNYMPEKPYYQNIRYRLDIPMMKEFLALRDAGKLDSIQMSWFNTKPVEELYDEEKDPHELHNLAGQPALRAKLEEMRMAFKAWTRHQRGVAVQRRGTERDGVRPIARQAGTLDRQAPRRLCARRLRH